MLASTGYLAIGFTARKCCMHGADAGVSCYLTSDEATRLASMVRVVLVSIV